jgi:ABC-type sugar transport system ATPase subunit
MIELRQVAICSGSFSLTGVSFSVAAGTCAALMGRTGQGKTTVLESICGLRRVTAGRILLRGKDVTRWNPAERSIGYVPQDLALFPTLNVAEHLEFALKLRRVPPTQIRERITELAALLGLSSLLSRRIKGLSGGEAQRVALGRALSFQPEVLLLDEPLSALDDQTRTGMQDLLRAIRLSTGVTMLLVTHNSGDARTLADRILLLENGRISESGVHADRHPA